MGLLVGKMGEGQRRATVESTAAARIVGGVRSVGGDHATLAAAAELVAVFEARAAVVAVRNRDGGPVRVWATDTGAGTASTLPAREDELQYLAPLPAEAVLFDRRRAVLRVVAVDRDARAVPATGEAVPLLGGRSWAVAMAADFTLGDEWSGRAYVLDPGPGFRGVDALSFLARLVKEVAPAVESVYLLSRLRSRAGAVERARVARELHDGVLQALIGLEMQVDVLRRRASMGEEEAAHPLTHIQAHLRHEIITVRELMEEIRPVEVSRRDLVEHIAGMVDRFRHETGLAASFVCAVEEVDLPGRVCRELVRVVQEALVNVRRHSGASSVMVRLEPRDDDWTLVIDDNGKGLSFAGRLDDRELAAQRLGPVVIRERVIALGGRLAVDSGPGRGTRLEVFVPQAARA
jgi:two-component system nitrate/nitrite sensor histidine kinase NarX